MSLFDIAAILVGLSALFRLLTHRYLKLPYTIGMMLIALVASGAVIQAHAIFSWSVVGEFLASGRLSCPSEA